MFKWISAAAGACALGLSTLQGLSTTAVLGVGLFALSPGLTPAAAHADVLPGWRRSCRDCMHAWRGGAPFRTGGYVAPGSAVTTRINGSTVTTRVSAGRVTATAERTYTVNGRTYVARATVVRTYSVRPVP